MRDKNPFNPGKTTTALSTFLLENKFFGSEKLLKEAVKESIQQYKNEEAGDLKRFIPVEILEKDGLDEH